jgi:membrane-associated phospholipid phosphatase
MKNTAQHQSRLRSTGVYQLQQLDDEVSNRANETTSRKVGLWSGSLIFGLLLTLVIASDLSAQAVEPLAGTWKTWVISSGKDYRVPAPPGPAETSTELQAMSDLIRFNDARTKEQITFWDAGSPAYRWIDLISERQLAGTPTTAYIHRVYAYVALAMYDATIATWESKYFFNRPRPNDLDPGIRTALPVPASPSYPSEHAAAARAAATVLAYFLPAEAQSFQTMAEQAGWSRVLAGLQYPSDYYAGLTLGRRVAEQVIAKAMRDGADAVWTGSVPTGPCRWIGTNPGNVTATNWIPLLLTSPSQFRPAPPPACDSAQVKAETAVVLNFARTFTTNYKAFYWQSPEGLQTWPYRYADKWMFEDGLDQNPPRAARVYALIAAAMFDAFIASQDGKFAYWYLRPHQNDPAIVPIFPVPNFPSYPSNHSTFSAARSEVLAYLFPAHADFIRAVGKEAGDSRIWAGIHYPMDNVAGVQLGKSVAQTFIAWAETASPTVTAPVLTLDAARYCVGGSWNLKVTNGRPNASIRLVGTINGKLWEVAQWGITDANGSYSLLGTFANGTEGSYVLTVAIDGLYSNSVSFVVSNCSP